MTTHPSPSIAHASSDALQQAERTLAQLGRVNPLALEEFAALEQRHKFLAEQLGDLTQTRKDLMTIIGDLDERMQTIFARRVRRHEGGVRRGLPDAVSRRDGQHLAHRPREHAHHRHRGRRCGPPERRSSGSRCCPAASGHWRPSRCSSRSSRHGPSPFYILDEVEAALDDANLGRLLTVFEQLRESSQLIVITHQKRTMEIADALYGVSMRQDGVSAVVGQRVGERVAERVPA